MDWLFDRMLWEPIAYAAAVVAAFATAITALFVWLAYRLQARRESLLIEFSFERLADDGIIFIYFKNRTQDPVNLRRICFKRPRGSRFSKRQGKFIHRCVDLDLMLSPDEETHFEFSVRVPFPPLNSYIVISMRFEMEYRFPMARYKKTTITRHIKTARLMSNR